MRITQRTGIPIDLTALTTRLNSFSGFDLSASEAADLINQARRDAAQRSHYPRKTADIGPTVAGQAAYVWPEDLLLVESVAVAGRAWGSSSRETVRQFERGELIPQVHGVWYDGADENGVRKLHLYPAPVDSQTLELEWVYQGAPLKSEEPTTAPDEFPEWFHPKLLHLAAETYYETVEDNPELAEQQKAKADLAVSELIRYDNKRRSGSGVFMPGIVGVTA